MSFSKKDEQEYLKQKKDPKSSRGEAKAYVKMGEEVAKITKKYD